MGVLGRQVAQVRMISQRMLQEEEEEEEEGREDIYIAGIRIQELINSIRMQ